VLGGCEGIGDNVMDTAPEASESVGCPVGRKTCPGSKLEDPIRALYPFLSGTSKHSADASDV
jgi:hypothetical protein